MSIVCTTRKYVTYYYGFYPLLYNYQFHLLLLWGHRKHLLFSLGVSTKNCCAYSSLAIAPYGNLWSAHTYKVDFQMSAKKAEGAAAAEKPDNLDQNIVLATYIWLPNDVSLELLCTLGLRTMT